MDPVPTPVRAPLPAFDRFTGQARRAIWLAYQESQRFDHDHLGTEHLLVGLLREGSPEIAAVFARQKVSVDAVLEKFEALMAQVEPAPETAAINLTPRARQALLAAIDASAKAHEAVATSIGILRAILNDAESATRQLLDELGFDVDIATAALAVDGSLNRDVLLQSTASSDPTRIDPTPAQLVDLLGGGLPHVEMAASRDPSLAAYLNDSDAAPIDSSLAELDYQLLLTQIVLAVGMGLSVGYILFEEIDGMVGAAVVLGFVAIFRNSVLGASAGAVTAFMVGRKVHPAGLTIEIVPLLLIGAGIGYFLGNGARRFCPNYLRPSMTRQKPPGVV